MVGVNIMFDDVNDVMIVTYKAMAYIAVWRTERQPKDGIMQY